MFVRIRQRLLKSGSASYAYLVDNQWNPLRRKNEQKIVSCLGDVKDLPKNSRLEKMILALDSFAHKIGMSSLSSGIILDNLSDEKYLTSSLDFGTYLLTRHLLTKLSFDSIFTSLWEKTNKKLKKVSCEKFLAATCALLARRLENRTDASELSTYEWYRNQLFIKEDERVSLTKDDFYRSLDILLSAKQEIEAAYFEANKDLFNQDLSLVLFDTTSVYYFGHEEIENNRVGKVNHHFKSEVGGATKNSSTDESAGSLGSSGNLGNSGGFAADRRNDILQYGFSKDGRSDLKQLIVGVLMTADGTPIAHEVFPGNQNDAKSFSFIIESVKKKYQETLKTKIGKVVLIADRGMVSEENLLNLEASGLSYIVGVKMRQLPKSLKEEVLMKNQDKIKEAIVKKERDLLLKDLSASTYLQTEANFEKITDDLFTKEFKLSELGDEELQEIIVKRILSGKKAINFDKDKILSFLKQRRLFVCFNPYEAISQMRKRKYFKKIIQNKIKFKTDKEWIIKNGYKKYLTFEGGINPKLNEEKLNNEELYDGKWIIMTNDKHISSYNAGGYYKTLANIERGFRDLKSLITVRPIFHFKETRIKAHIFVCFLSLILKWYVFKILNTKSIPNFQNEGRRFMEKILNLKAIEVDRKTALYIRTEIDEELKQGMQKLNMKIIGKILFDKRQKPEPVQKKAGRPKKEDTNQLKLIP